MFQRPFRFSLTALAQAPAQAQAQARAGAQAKAQALTAAAFAVAAFAAAAFGQDVKYEKYKLDNGLTVILHEDHSLPMASVNIWYKVGSKDEPKGRSGFAHLFEHLMFMGTRRVPGADFDNLMEAGGGWNNASTSEDRTNYFEVGPATLLPTLLWLEADRLEDLANQMDLAKLNKQRAVVRNERRQSYENQPYGLAELRVYEEMFPEGHPYHIPVIGTHEDLEAATVEDVRSFFRTYYVPANASLVVAGDFKPAEVKPLIQQLFGTLAKGAEPPHRDSPPVKLDKPKKVTMTDAVQYPRTTFVYHSPKHFAPGDAELDLAAAILSDGISSRLYQELIYKNKLATDVSAYQASMQLGSLFYVEVTALPDVPLEKVEAAADEVIAAFVKEGPTEDELERQKSKLEYQAVSSLQSIMTKADRLNQYEFAFGEPNSFERDLNRYRQATREGVQKVAQSVLDPSARLVLRVLPGERTSSLGPAEAIESGRPEEKPQEPPQEKPQREPSARDQRPETPKASAFSAPLPETFALKNGVRVHHWQRPGLPLMRAAVLLTGGAEQDSRETAGLASLTADMLDEGAGDRDAMAFADALDAVGAQYVESVDHEATTIEVEVLTRNFDKALALMADAVLRPRFDEKEWKRVQSLRVDGLKAERDRPTSVAALVASRSFFGDAHPYGRPVEGTPASVEKLTLDQVKAFHKDLYTPSNARILTAGSMTKDQVRVALEKAFGPWGPTLTAEEKAAGAGVRMSSENFQGAGAKAMRSPSYPEPANATFRVVVVDRPDSVQTVIRYVMPGPSFGSPDRPRLELLGTILGGSFTSRLNQNLRESHGYTYGARAGYTFGVNAGYMSAGASVRADVTGASLKEFATEFRKIKGGDISDKEAQKAREMVRTRTVQSFERLAGLIDQGIERVINEKPFPSLTRELEALDQVTASQLNALARTSIPLEKGVLVLVGDEDVIGAQTRDLGLPTPVRVNVEGDPAKAAEAKEDGTKPGE
ncbi:MAG: insulinase family protein [Phycisphaerales bacterium]|nr:MAG: insulinase family protein [Phycisphaerales bacterium]